MKITLINPPWYVSERRFLQDGSLSQCLGLGYIASYLQSQGHKIEFIDALAEGTDHFFKTRHKGQRLIYHGLSYDAIVKKISGDTELIGVSVPFTNLASIVKKLCALIKNNYPKIPLVVGGIHPSVFPYGILDENIIDYAIRGEGEIPMLKLASGKEPSRIKGLVYRKGKDFIDNGFSEQIEDLNRLPFPYHPPHLIERYISYSPRGQRHKRSLSMITSRGCPYDCLFCSIHPVSSYYWRARSPKNVLEEIVYYMHKYAVNHIEFEDDNLTLDSKRAEEIFDGILGFKTKISWAVNNGLRVDTLSARLIEKMKKSGCVQVNLAIESGSQKTLDLMHKKLSLKKVEEVVEICSDLKIPTLGFFLVGYPGETAKTFSETVAYIRRLKRKGLKRIGAMIVNAYPGTKLYHYCKQKGYLSNDIDTHIFFVDTDYVSITTGDFNAETVFYWRDYLEGIFTPFRWKIKKLLKLILSAAGIFKRLLFVYRNIRETKLRRKTELGFS